MRQYLFGCLGIFLAACVLDSAPVQAQEQRAVESLPLKFLDVGSAPQKVDLLLGKARILELPRDVRDVLVANPDIADVVVRTPRLVYLLGREVGDTNVFFFDLEGNEILRLNARVELDLSTLRAALKEFLPDEDVRASSVNQNIILTGTVGSAAVADDARELARRFVDDDASIINMLDIEADQQVVLKVRIAEMQRTALKQLGLNLSFNIGRGSSSARFSMLNLPPFGIGGVPLVNVLGDAEAREEVVGTALLAGGFRELGGLGYVIDALERNGLVKTLAEPNLTALSGETANFLAGGEIGFDVVTADTATVEFKPFGISLDFTPVVLSSGRISLRVHTEVSAVVDVAGRRFVARRASTTVELPSGGSLVIAGLLQDDITNSIEGIPGLKNLPIFGALFRSVGFRRQETELVIAVTVYPVRPIDEQQIVFPTDGFAPTSDIDLYLLGRLHATYARSDALPLAELKAPTGYILE